jgi:hypothetical protein
MIGTRILAITAMAAGCLVVAGAPAEAATTAQFKAKCRAVWTGKATTAAYRSYSRRCVKAAAAATSAATDAGTPTSKPANRLRAITACTVQFPLPRNTRARRKAYNTCVKAASNAQRSFGARPLSATMKGASVVPKAGSATGRLSLRLNEGARRVCFTLSASGLGASGVTGASIRRGALGRNGKVAIQLGDSLGLDALNQRNTVEACVTRVPKATIRAIRKRPTSYYVMVTTFARPLGATRGQLHGA